MLDLYSSRSWGYLDLDTDEIFYKLEASSNSWSSRDDGSLVPIMVQTGYDVGALEDETPDDMDGLYDYYAAEVLGTVNRSLWDLIPA